MNENPLPLALFPTPGSANWSKLVEALDALAAEDKELEKFLNRALPSVESEGEGRCASIRS